MFSLCCLWRSFVDLSLRLLDFDILFMDLLIIDVIEFSLYFIFDFPFQIASCATRKKIIFFGTIERNQEWKKYVEGEKKEEEKKGNRMVRIE
jgi:hypothetical protein